MNRDAESAPRAGSAFMAFVTGGLPGLLGALDSRAGASFEDDVDDPDALRRAEDAVAQRPRGSVTDRASGSRPIDEAWSIVATQIKLGDTAGLDDVTRSLAADGVDFGWDPYDPRDAVNFMPPSAGLAARKPFSVVVPSSQVLRARESLYGQPPSGVTYSWPTDGVSPAAPDAESDFASSPAVRRSVGADGMLLSDNARLERTAGRGPSAAATAVLVLIIVGTVIAVGGVLLSLTKG